MSGSHVAEMSVVLPQLEREGWREGERERNRAKQRERKQMKDSDGG